MKRPRGYYVDPADEQFNLLFREGGGYPVDDNTGDRDCISQMGLAEHSPRVLFNALCDLRCQVFDSNHVETRSSGGSLLPVPFVRNLETIFKIDKDAAQALNQLDRPIISRDRRFMVRVPREQRLISKQLQNLSAIALMLLSKKA